MVAGATPQRRYVATESERLANADLSERDRHTGGDHSAHAARKICVSCGRPIEAEQPARRRGETDVGATFAAPPSVGGPVDVAMISPSVGCPMLAQAQ
jgi:hypothetical protein